MMNATVPLSPTPLLVDTATAARLLGVSPRTVWTLISEGQLHAVRIRRAVRISVAELQRFVERCEGACNA
jgi:excisionase family DNA binding protein